MYALQSSTFLISKPAAPRPNVNQAINQNPEIIPNANFQASEIGPEFQVVFHGTEERSNVDSILRFSEIGVKAW